MANRRSPILKETSSEALRPWPTAGSSVTAAQTDTTSERESIARLAYSYWLGRACQGGSPEEDWLLAEQQLRSQIGSGIWF